MMTEFIRAYKSNFKLNNKLSTWCIYILPWMLLSAIFLLFLIVSPSYTSDYRGIFFFLQLCAILFPCFIALISSQLLSLDENAGSFQNMFCILNSKVAVFCGKLCYLFTVLFVSIVIGLTFFSIGYIKFLKAENFSFDLMLKFALVLLLSSIPICILHMFLSMRFGKSISIIVGIVEVILAAISEYLLLNLIWVFIPCSWAAYFYNVKVFESMYKGTKLDQILYFLNNNKFGLNLSLAFIILTFVIFIVVSLIWFKHWEGKKSIE